MRFGSVCSGIEAASVAWEPLGWKAAWFAEIEPFPSAVLKYHYANTPNLGDMTEIPALIRSGDVEAPEIFCGGTPCQAFSVAGLRRSLDDARGNLSLTFCEIANAIDDVRSAGGEPPAIIFWENVPGVLSTKDNAFGCFLAGLAGEELPLVPPGGKWTDAGIVYGPQRAVAWRILDAQYFGVAQRRKRVFVVASAREGFDPVEVLLEFDGVRRDSAPSREAGKVAPTIPSRSTAGGGLGTDFDCDGGVITMAHGQGGAEIGFGRGPTLTCNHEAPIAAYVTHSLRGEGFDASEDGTGRGTPLVPVGVTIHGTDPTVQRVASYDEVAQCLRARTPGNIDNSSTTVVQQPICFDTTQITSPLNRSHPQAGDPCHPLAAGAHPSAIAFKASHYTRGKGSAPSEVVPPLTAEADRGDQDPIVAYGFQPRIGRNGRGDMGDLVSALTSQAGETGKGDAAPCVVTGGLRMHVRRFTPTERERLQGFPDGYTAIPWRGKPVDLCPDGPRYKALGNSWAVPVVRWIGERIDWAIKAAKAQEQQA